MKNQNLLETELKGLSIKAGQSAIHLWISGKKAVVMIFHQVLKNDDVGFRNFLLLLENFPACLSFWSGSHRAGSMIGAGSGSVQGLKDSFHGLTGLISEQRRVKQWGTCLPSPGSLCSELQQ